MRRHTFELIVAMLLGASACCLSEVSGIDLDGGEKLYLGDAGRLIDAGGLQKYRGCPLDQQCSDICWCEPHFCGCTMGALLCFYETDAGCIHTECLTDGWDDANCGGCDKACRPGAHCDAGVCVAAPR